MQDRNGSGQTAAELMNGIVQHTRALDHSFAMWDDRDDRKAAADALQQVETLEGLLGRFHERLTSDAQRWDREHDEIDPRD